MSLMIVYFLHQVMLFKGRCKKSDFRGHVVYFYTQTPKYILNYYGVLSNIFYAIDTQMWFKLDIMDLCVSKLNTVLYSVQTWMFVRKTEVE